MIDSSVCRFLECGRKSSSPSPPLPLGCSVAADRRRRWSKIVQVVVSGGGEEGDAPSKGGGW